MKVLLISVDLIIQSRVAAAAARAGLAPPRACDWATASALQDISEYGIVILDLSTPGLEIAGTVAMLRRRLEQSTPIVAFAPHVHAAKLEAARAAGCDQVFSRGQLDRELDTLLEARPLAR
jgi:DNA-binding response OmpR family regulator